MPTRNVSLTPEQDAFVESLIAQGHYASASEVMRDALRSLQHRRAMDELRLERLRRSIAAGIADLERGDYEDIPDSDLEAWFERLVEQR